MKNSIIYILITVTVFFSCNNTDDLGTNCDFVADVNAEKYAIAESDDFEMMSTELVDDCLEVTFWSSGCNGTTWKTKLIDSGEILESFPPQRNLFFELKNEELCEAYIKKTVSFDVSGLLEGYDDVIFNITNAKESVLETDCDFIAEVNAVEYAIAESDSFKLVSTELVDDCMEITFAASGCVGQSWATRLIDSGEILESLPPQRNLFFELKNEELCTAYIIKTVSFDVSELLGEYDDVIFNIVNVEK